MSNYKDLIAIDKEDVESPEELAAEHKRKKLPAEVTFDKAVYGGISYWAQMLTGIGLSYWFKHGSGKQLFEKICDNLGPKIFSATAASKGVKAASERLNSPLIVTTMVMVGNTFMIPVLWLEKHKPKIVRWIHSKTAATEPDYTEEKKQHDEAALYELEHAPKQNLSSILGGRAFGLAGVFATVFTMGKAEKSIQTFTTKTAQNAFKVVGLKEIAKSPVAKRLMDISFLDAFYSAIAAGGLYVYSHYINPPKKKPVGAEEVSPPLESTKIEELPSEIAGEPKPKITKVTPKKNLLDKAPPVSFTQKLQASEAPGHGPQLA